MNLALSTNINVESERVFADPPDGVRVHIYAKQESIFNCDFQSFENLSRTGHWYLNLKSNDLNVTPFTARLLGLKNGQHLTTQNLFNYFPFGNDIQLQKIHRKLSFGEHCSFETGVRNQIGKIFPVQISIQRKSSSEYFGTIQATSHFKRKSEDKSNGKGETQKSIENNARYVSFISHEIRTPLNAIVALTHILQEDNHNNFEKETLNALKFSSENLVSIVNNILDLSKLSENKLNLNSSPFLLKNFIHHLSQSMVVTAQEKEIQLFYQLDHTIPKIVLGDHIRLKQVLINLLSNAIKFSPAGECVQLRVVKLKENQSSVHLKFSVEDSGVGIPKDKIPTIFKPYEQLNDSNSKQGLGTGLGLSICQKIVKLFGGEIHVESEENKGSIFSFDVVLKVDNQLQYQAVSESLTKEKFNFSQKRFLMAEDHVLNRNVFEKLFNRVGANVDFATNGLEALALVQENVYDLILMDLNMPEMGGRDATEIIKNKYRITTPILALTANTESEVDFNIEMVGFSGLITKPCPPDQLYQVINSILFPAENRSSKPNKNDRRSNDEVKLSQDIINLKILKDLFKTDAEGLDKVKESIINELNGVLQELPTKDVFLLSRRIHMIKPTLKQIGALNLLMLLEHYKEAIDSRNSKILNSSFNQLKEKLLYTIRELQKN